MISMAPCKPLVTSRWNARRAQEFHGISVYQGEQIASHKHHEAHFLIPSLRVHWPYASKNCPKKRARPFLHSEECENRFANLCQAARHTATQKTYSILKIEQFPNHIFGKVGISAADSLRVQPGHALCESGTVEMLPWRTCLLLSAVVHYACPLNSIAPDLQGSQIPKWYHRLRMIDIDGGCYMLRHFDTSQSRRVLSRSHGTCPRDIDAPGPRAQSPWNA